MHLQIQSPLKYSLIVILLLTLFNTNTVFAKNQSNNTVVNFQKINDFAMLADASYFAKPRLEKTEFTFCKLSYYSDITDLGISYFLATDEPTKTHNIAVRGTSNIENVVVNLALKLTPDDHTGISLHRGFLISAKAIYDELKPKLKKGYTVNTTGHSLGGAVALILAMYLDSDNIKIGQVITFGQPKVTNIPGSYKFQHLDITRVVTPDDLVPLVPIMDPMDIKNIDIYWHQGIEIILLPKTNYSMTEGISSMLRATKFTQQALTKANIINHKMTEYVLLIDKKIPDSNLVPYKTSFNLFNMFGISETEN